MQSVPLLFSQGSRYAFLFFLCPVLYNLTIVGLYWGGCKWIHVIMSLWILLLDFTHYFLHPLFFSNLPGIRSDGSCWWNYQWPWVRLLLFHMFLGLSRFFSDVSLPQVLIYIYIVLLGTRYYNWLLFYVACSYKFEFPSPDDRPGPPIISFRLEFDILKYINMLYVDISFEFMKHEALISLLNICW